MNIAAEPTPIHFYKDRDADGRRLAVVYACRVKWEELERTANDLVRYCTNCSQPVFQVADLNGFERAVAARRCVMVEPEPGRGMWLGEPRLDTYKSGGPLSWEGWP